MPDREAAKRIFMAALDLYPAERPAFIASQCQVDAHLQREVEALLAAHDGEPILDATTTSAAPQPPPTDASPVSETVGTRIGHYKLLQQIGEGGFGVVFMADQEFPVRRRVALKIIKLGMDTRRVVARFEAERQALAMMDHPHIARVLDAGSTDSGRPYFVMELVKGDPITDYCDRNNLSIPERLELFTQVCNAVQHAHTKGVMHRDIKPTNVLVHTQDGRPHAKVIDFGIAKATDHRLTEKTLFTEHKALIGTPAYMSPEQAEGSMDIDTRTDVYSLGVLIYELLTGSTPLDNMELRAAAFAELQRIIRETDPPKPSTRLSQSAESLSSIAARRRVEPRKLGVLVRGELDWIVMKALEKDRARRYETASAFAADVGRHLTGEPVIAAPPSVGYRLRKFARRNRPAVIAVSTVAFALALAAGISIWFWRSEVDSRSRERETVLRETEQRIWAEKQLPVFLLCDIANNQLREKQFAFVELLLQEAQTFNEEYVSGDQFHLAHDENDVNIIEALADLERARGNKEEAERYYQELLSRRKGLERRRIVVKIAELLMEHGYFAEAERILRQTISSIWKSGRYDFPIELTLADSLVSLGRFAEAETVLLKIYNRDPTEEGLMGTLHRGTAARELVSIYEARNAAEPTESHRATAECWRIRLEECDAELEAIFVPVDSLQTSEPTAPKELRSPTSRPS